MKLSEEPILPDVLSALQLRTLNEPLLPNLRTLKFTEAPADIIPFIPLFLSRRTTRIYIHFTTSPPAVMIASVIINLSTLCPHMQNIALQTLPNDSTITHAVSEMLLACNADTLRVLHVDSALTEEARQVVYRLPNLHALRSTIRDPATPLLEVSLPNLAQLLIEYHHGHDWLQAFHGATLPKLAEVAVYAQCEEIGDFLEAFESVAIATSASTTLLAFEFYTSRPWNPNYYSLLSFRQLRRLIIEFSCHDGCSSRVDDDIILTLARAMPKLEILLLGKTPCQAPTNVTVQGLIALAHHCPGLSKLCVHFQTETLVVLAFTEAISPPGGGSHPPPEGCALTNLDVGEIPLLQPYLVVVVLTLLRIFPRLIVIEYVNEEWRWVAETVRLSKRIDTFIRRSGKMD